MWFVLEAGSERTIATTHYKDIAEMIARDFPVACIIRYNPELEYGSYTANSTYFEVKEIAKGA